MLTRILCILGVCLALLTSAVYADVPNSFSFQGKLTNPAGAPVADGTYNVEFVVYESATGGLGLWSDKRTVATHGGMFSTNIGQGGDPMPGDLFNGANRWLGIKLDDEAEMSPRIMLVSVPYALKAGGIGLPWNAAGASTDPILSVMNNGIGGGLRVIAAQGFAGLFASQAGSSPALVVNNYGTGPAISVNAVSGGLAADFNGTISAIGLRVTGLPVPGQVLTCADMLGNAVWSPSPTSGWSLTGNSGTNATTNFLGTTDSQPLDLKVSNQRALRLQPASTSFGYFSPNVIGGSELNTVSASVGAAFIGGGGSNGRANTVTDDYGVIAGGSSNRAGDNAGDRYDSQHATVGGGDSNVAGGPYSVVAGGQENNATGHGSAILGGYSNTASQIYATVGGGGVNTASGMDSTVGGGEHNVASGYYAAVPGGTNNTAQGVASFAAGSHAKALHHGAFVWADMDANDFASTNVNQFLIRASGGVGIGVNNPQQALSVGGAMSVDQANQNNGGVLPGIVFGWSSGEGIASKRTAGGNQYGLDLYTGFVNRMAITSVGRVGIGTTTPGYTLHVNGSVAGVGAYNQLSDGRFKTDVTEITGAVDKVEALRGVTYRWKSDACAGLDVGDGRQIGVIAQEVQKVLPEAVTKDDGGTYSVAYSTFVPLLIEAVKEQQKTIEGQQAQIDQLIAELAELKAQQ